MRTGSCAPSYRTKRLRIQWIHDRFVRYDGKGAGQARRRPEPFDFEEPDLSPRPEGLVSS